MTDTVKDCNTDRYERIMHELKRFQKHQDEQIGELNRGVRSENMMLQVPKLEARRIQRNAEIDSLMTSLNGLHKEE